MAEIAIEGVSKYFGKAQALRDISLKLESGRIYGMIGHNGSGKTVLMKLICGFLRCSQGRILIDGKEMGVDIDILPNAGIIIEEPAFLRNWSGMKNLEFLYGIRNAKNRERLCAVMKLVGLDPESRKPVGKYSLGMKQRLAIAQAIMEDPDILILDEPMNGLDKKGTLQMREVFLKEKEKGKLILLASHNKEDIDVLCDEVHELEGGNLIR